jgi:UDP-arabinose 4-epimerase
MTGKRVLVTGGAGYIGSHTSKALKGAGFEPVAFDNLSTGHADNVKWGPLFRGDIRNREDLVRAIHRHKPEAVIHFAAFAYVGESVIDPAKYYSNNVVGMQVLLDTCRASGIRDIVFSSSCATYGIPEKLPIDEGAPQRPINPYGRTKLVGEFMLADYARAYDLGYVALRYFNACGADPDGELGERHDPETHLIPRTLMAASGAIDRIDIYGDDYDTPDGTCIRDYIHVTDLAEAHVRALDYLRAKGPPACVNVGTGRGHSIGEIIAAVRRNTGLDVPTHMAVRRPGDPPVLFAETALARELFGFEPKHSDIDTIISTAAAFMGLRAATSHQWQVAHG